MTRADPIRSTRSSICTLRANRKVTPGGSSGTGPTCQRPPPLGGILSDEVSPALADSPCEAKVPSGFSRSTAPDALFQVPMSSWRGGDWTCEAKLPSRWTATKPTSTANTTTLRIR